MTGFLPSHSRVMTDGRSVYASSSQNRLTSLCTERRWQCVSGRSLRWECECGRLFRLSICSLLLHSMCVCFLQVNNSVSFWQFCFTRHTIVLSDDMFRSVRDHFQVFLQERRLCGPSSEALYSGLKMAHKQTEICRLRHCETYVSWMKSSVKRNEYIYIYIYIVCVCVCVPCIAELSSLWYVLRIYRDE